VVDRILAEPEPPEALVVAFLHSYANRANEQRARELIAPRWPNEHLVLSSEVLPLWLDVLSHLSPMRYAVDLARGIFYSGHPEFSAVVLASPLFNLVLIAVLFVGFLGIGTFLFVRGERNR
jgi:ABC-2 type transport system permease protein